MEVMNRSFHESGGIHGVGVEASAKFAEAFSFLHESGGIFSRKFPWKL